MALLKQCFCYTLRQGSFIIGTYSLIIYCIAFAIELWWIIESLLILPAPAYTLCTLYFINFVMAAVLLFGLLVRDRKHLLSWSLVTVLSFFPEAGMVLFMSLYYWPFQKYEYGVIELIFWSLRAVFNIFGSLCVCSLYLCWRDEELILGKLTDLTLSNVESNESQEYNNRMSYYEQSRLRSKNNPKAPIGYHNLAYLDTPSQQNYFGRGWEQQSIYNAQDLRPTLKRSSKSFNNSPPHQTSSFENPYSKHPSHLTLSRNRHSIHLTSNLSPYNSSKNFHQNPSQFDPQYSPFTHKNFANNERAKSLHNLSGEEYWEHPPPSRPTSLAYVNYATFNRNNNNIHHKSMANVYNYSNNCSKAGNLKNQCNGYGGMRKNNTMSRRKSVSVEGLSSLYRASSTNYVPSRNNMLVHGRNNNYNRLGYEWNRSSDDETSVYRL